MSEFLWSLTDAQSRHDLQVARAWQEGYERGYEDGHCEKDGIVFPERENPYVEAKS